MPGYEVVRGAVPRERIDAALRLLHGDMLRRGVDAKEVGEWLWAMHWFPHLRFEDEISALAEALPEPWQEGTRCEPQILLQFPHVGEPEPEISFHLDQEPDWAQGRRYVRIVGIALSDWTTENGGLVVKTDGGLEPVTLAAGDAVMMTPDLPHSGGVNRTGEIRYGVYFRFLGDD
jgi:ectoine hydroxylase-related dioxygenase (phytanoyl-CoA dioxygenase family)